WGGLVVSFASPAAGFSRGRRPLYWRWSASTRSALKVWITSRTRSGLVNVTRITWGPHHPVDDRMVRARAVAVKRRSGGRAVVRGAGAGVHGEDIGDEAAARRHGRCERGAAAQPDPTPPGLAAWAGVEVHAVVGAAAGHVDEAVGGGGGRRAENDAAEADPAAPVGAVEPVDVPAVVRAPGDDHRLGRVGRGDGRRALDVPAEADPAGCGSCRRRAARQPGRRLWPWRG